MSFKEPDYEAVWRDRNLWFIGFFYAAQGAAFGALVPNPVPTPMTISGWSHSPSKI
jgi:hypothetical protein